LVKLVSVGIIQRPKSNAKIFLDVAVIKMHRHIQAKANQPPDSRPTAQPNTATIWAILFLPMGLAKSKNKASKTNVQNC
jgi:hypothetical protein